MLTNKPEVQYRDRRPRQIGAARVPNEPAETRDWLQDGEPKRVPRARARKATKAGGGPGGQRTKGRMHVFSRGAFAWGNPLVTKKPISGISLSRDIR